MPSTRRRSRLERATATSRHGADRASRGRRILAVRPRRADQGGHAEAGDGHEVEDDLGHDAEGAFAAGHDLGQVVADVVLHEAGEAARDGAVGEHDLDPAQAGAHRAVADDVDAAGVGGDHAAERGGVPGRDVDAELACTAAAACAPRRASCPPRPRGAPRRGRSDRTRLSRPRLSTTSPLAGTEPPTRPVLPPWGTTGTPKRLHSGEHLGDLGGVRRGGSPRESGAAEAPVQSIS